MIEIEIEIEIEKVLFTEHRYMPCKKPGKDAEASTQAGLASDDISGLIVIHGSYIA